MHTNFIAALLQICVNESQGFIDSIGFPCLSRDAAEGCSLDYMYCSQSGHCGLASYCRKFENAFRARVCVRSIRAAAPRAEPAALD